jgi:HEAT repeat protein
MGSAAATPEVLEALLDRLRSDKDSDVRRRAVEALERFLSFRTFLPRSAS